MIEKLEGFIVSEVPSGESSKIINVLTKEKGLVGVIAKNSKSIKSPLRVKSNKFTYGIFHIKYNINKLSNLIEVDIIDHFQNIKKDIILLSYLSYLTELTTYTYRTSESNEIYPLFIETIKKLNDGISCVSLTNILEIKYLKYLGVDINYNGCIHCGSQEKIITIDQKKNGFICQNCYTNEEIISPKIIKTILLYKNIDIKRITKLEIDKDTTTYVNDFISNYYDTYTGIYLKSKKFLDIVKS